MSNTGDRAPAEHGSPPFHEPVGDFDFGEATATVFDDMLDRSIPEYRELQRMIGELAATFAEPGACPSGGWESSDTALPASRSVNEIDSI